MATLSKTGTVRFDVTTDTHNSPWGFRNGVNGKTIYFDLGDNTRGRYYEDIDFPEVMSVCQDEDDNSIALFGNHDTAVNGGIKKGLQIYRDYDNQIIFFGLDVGTEELSVYEIPQAQIKSMANTLSSLTDGWDIVVLTHVPLFPPTNSANSSWNCGAAWTTADYNNFENPEDLVDLLVCFKEKTPFVYGGTTYNFPSNRPNCRVIGCFAGHIHYHVKCIYRGIPMETFPSNGSEEWTTTGGLNNEGMYDPYESYIGINFDTNTVNGQNFVSPSNANYFYPYPYYHDTASECPYMTNAIGVHKINANSSAYPKFYSGVYIGYSNSAAAGTSFGKANYGDRYYSFGGSRTLSVGGTSITATAIMFDDNGRLRYYKNGGDVSDCQAYTEIPNYKTATVTFTTNNGVVWTFRKGLLISAN